MRALAGLLESLEGGGEEEEDEKEGEDLVGTGDVDELLLGVRKGVGIRVILLRQLDEVERERKRREQGRLRRSSRRER